MTAIELAINPLCEVSAFRGEYGGVTLTPTLFCKMKRYNLSVFVPNGIGSRSRCNG